MELLDHKKYMERAIQLSYEGGVVKKTGGSDSLPVLPKYHDTSISPSL